MLRSTCLFALLVAAALLGIALAEVRTWRDTTGKFSVEAELVEETETDVKLRKADGSIKTVPKKLLSKEDLAHLDELKSVKAKAARKDQKWRKDYNALVETIKVKDLGDGKYEIDWGEAKELGDWYKIAAEAADRGVKLPIRPKTNDKLNEWKATIKQAEKAHEAIDDVEWTAKSKKVSVGFSGVRLELPPLPKPLTIGFHVDKADEANWTGLRK